MAKSGSHPRHLRQLLFSALAVMFALTTCTSAQTPSTGAIIGVVVDPAGAFVPGVAVRLQKEGGMHKKTVDTDQNGQFGFLLLEPGTYSVNATLTGFRPVAITAINVHVTETVRVSLRLRVSMRTEQIQVFSSTTMVDPDKRRGSRQSR